MKIYEFEVTRKALRVAEPREAITDAAAVARISKEIIGDIDHEVMIVMHLDARNKIRGYHEAGRGGLTSCAVDPMQVFRAALIAGAAGIVLVHNHPSGDPSPSADDITLTGRLRDGAKLLGVKVLDHVILGEGRHFSMLDAGIMS